MLITFTIHYIGNRLPDIITLSVFDLDAAEELKDALYDCVENVEDVFYDTPKSYLTNVVTE